MFVFNSCTYSHPCYLYLPYIFTVFSFTFSRLRHTAHLQLKSHGTKSRLKRGALNFHCAAFVAAKVLCQSACCVRCSARAKISTFLYVLLVTITYLRAIFLLSDFARIDLKLFVQVRLPLPPHIFLFRCILFGFIAEDFTADNITLIQRFLKILYLCFECAYIFVALS